MKPSPPSTSPCPAKTKYDFRFVPGGPRGTYLPGEATADGRKRLTAGRHGVRSSVRKKARRIAVEFGEQRNTPRRHRLQNFEVTRGVVVGIAELGATPPEALVVADDHGVAQPFERTRGFHRSARFDGGRRFRRGFELAAERRSEEQNQDQEMDAS